MSAAEVAPAPPGDDTARGPTRRFVTDFLTEQLDIESENYVESVVNGRTIYTLHFQKAVTLDAVSQAIRELDPDEIERIWLLNNGP